jgi:spore coat protein CotH
MDFLIHSRVQPHLEEVPWSSAFRRATLLLGAVVLFGCGESSPSPSPVRSSSGGSSATSGGAGSSAVSAGSGGSAGAGAAPGGASSAGGSAGAAAGVGGAPAGAAGMTVDTSPELYDPELVPRFDIELSPESVAALDAMPDVYTRGVLRYKDEVVSEIGVRIKGEASQRTLEEKAAFKLKFDEFVPKQSFRGLRRMTFNNMVEDPTFLAERLAYHFFRSVGLPAPRCNSALLYVNGEPFGIYANIETEDKTFLRRWFESDAGNLYEEGQVDFEPGNEAMFDLETNEELNDRSDLTALIAAAGRAMPASYLEDVGAELDMEHFLAFTAAEGAVNQWDMYGYTVFYPNNFRLYRDPTKQRFVMLPWGMDMSMKPFRDSGKPHIELLELARVGDFAQGSISAGLLFRGCLSSPACKTAYVAAAEDMANRYEQAGMLALANDYYLQIKDHVAADPRKEYSLAEFEAAIEAQREVIGERPAAMRESLAP